MSPSARSTVAREPERQSPPPKETRTTAEAVKTAASNLAVQAAPAAHAVAQFTPALVEVLRLSAEDD